MNKSEFDFSAIHDIVPGKLLSEDTQQQLQSTFESFMALNHLYESAIKIVRTQLSIIDEEYNARFQRNPIHGVKDRIKDPVSIIKKLQRKGLLISPSSAQENLHDIAGVRVICDYIDDIYTIADCLATRSGFTMVKLKDYIKNPKKNGYRSLHLIVHVPVYLSASMEMVPVEIQIRTIAMDFWASLEHQLHYKSIGNEAIAAALTDELTDCAESIAEIDLRMQNMFKQINEL